jgi:hypothetical protein
MSLLYIVEIRFCRRKIRLYIFSCFAHNSVGPDSVEIGIKIKTGHTRSYIVRQFMVYRFMLKPETGSGMIYMSSFSP